MTHSIENSQFEIHNRKEIVFVLEDLIKHRTTINLDAGGSVGLVTAVLAISANNEYVYFDVSTDEAINDKILASKHVKFSTQSGVKIRWFAMELRYVELHDGTAFEMPIPKAIERIQRRKYFRLHTPQGNNALLCKIPVDELAGEKYNASVIDMSVGGLGISVRGDPPPFLFHGAILANCGVIFPEVGSVLLNLKVCGIIPYAKTKSGEQLYHFGMEFIDLNRSASNVVQRYMIQLESERISKT
ncbi:MAG: flagellar brake protein [Gallionellaceae bacterium]